MGIFGKLHGHSLGDGEEQEREKNCMLSFGDGLDRLMKKKQPWALGSFCSASLLPLSRPFPASSFLAIMMPCVVCLSHNIPHDVLSGSFFKQHLTTYYQLLFPKWW